MAEATHKVLQDFEPTETCQLLVRKGEQCTLLNKLGESAGWCNVRTFNGTGLVPSRCLQPLILLMPQVKSPSDNLKLKGELYVVQYDFRALDAYQLDIKKDDRLTLIDYHSNDWLAMKNARGRIGLVPATYVNLASLQERAQAEIQSLSYAEEALQEVLLSIDNAIEKIQNELAQGRGLNKQQNDRLMALTTHRRRVLNEYIYNRIERRDSTKASSHGDLRSVTGGSNRTFVRLHRRAYSTSADNDAIIDMDLRKNGSKVHQTHPPSASVKRSKSCESRSGRAIKHMNSVKEKQTASEVEQQVFRELQQLTREKERVQQLIQHDAQENTLDQVVQLQAREIKQLNIQLLETTKRSQQLASKEEQHIREKEQLTRENDQLTRENDLFTSENERVSREKEQLIRENERIRRELQSRTDELQQVMLEKNWLEEELRKVNTRLQQQLSATAMVTEERDTEQPHWVVKRKEVELTEKVVGRGGWGEVKVARFRGLKVAAKFLYEVILSDYNCQQFSREMTIAAKIRHPNLLLFIGATREGEAVILTELMPTSLRRELGTRVLPRVHITSIAQDVACALRYLHQWRPSPIIHRDISSANVLLEPLPNGWRAKVSDYGSAQFMNAVTTAAPGSPAYAAPEAPFPFQHSPMMDTFSYGVLLIEMCIRRLPESSPAQREAQILQIQWASMVSLVRRCTSERPADRPSMRDIMELLASITDQ